MQSGSNELPQTVRFVVDLSRGQTTPSKPSSIISLPSLSTSFTGKTPKLHKKPETLEIPIRIRMHNQMVKKRVPEWLNSSLWSSPPSAFPADDDRAQRYTSKPSTPTTTTTSASVVEPPLPVPPPSSAREQPPPEPQPVDSVSDHDDRGAAVPSPEDFSRQSQLLAEVRV